MTSTITISDARANLPDIVKNTQQMLARYFITVHGKPKAVVLSIEDLESLEETAEVLAIPGAEKSIKTGLAQVRKKQGKPLAKLD